MFYKEKLSLKTSKGYSSCIELKCKPSLLVSLQCKDSTKIYRESNKPEYNRNVPCTTDVLSIKNITKRFMDSTAIWWIGKKSNVSHK